MPISELKSDIKKLEFLNTLPSDKVVEWFKCGGYWWKVNFDITKLTAGNYIDMDMWVKEPEKILSNSHKILSLFCQPFKWLRKYNKMTDEDKYEKLKHCRFGFNNNILKTFWKNISQYINLSEDFIREYK